LNTNIFFILCTHTTKPPYKTHNSMGEGHGAVRGATEKFAVVVCSGVAALRIAVQMSHDRERAGPKKFIKIN
jgi:hypothetical protein